MKLLTLILLLSASPTVFSGQSICYGTTSQGRLEGGVKLPSAGANFVSYSKTGEQLGRTYVHSKVRDILLTSFEELEKMAPGKIFQYGETGFEKGGKFWPHRTHQNGLSVDFLVPVLNPKGISIPLPTSSTNQFGYAIEFDDSGKYQDLQIDYEAMAAHLTSLHKTALAKGVKIERVIFDPKLQFFLRKTKYGNYLKRNIQFSKKRAWVRHDEHYHVDFKLPCQPN